VNVEERKAENRKKEKRATCADCLGKKELQGEERGKKNYGVGQLKPKKGTPSVEAGGKKRWIFLLRKEKSRDSDNGGDDKSREKGFGSPNPKKIIQYKGKKKTSMYFNTKEGEARDVWDIGGEGQIHGEKKKFESLNHKREKGITSKGA